MEAVLPLKTSGDWSNHDLQRAKILVYTLSHFWRGTNKLSLTIITPRSDEMLVKRELTSDIVDIRVINEVDIIPLFSVQHRFAGWYKQQILKLAYSLVTTDDFFLTLDADLICTHAISQDFLVIENKALTDWEPRSTHPEWWRGSAEVLRVAPRIEGMGIAVTPAILSSTICQKLIRYISELSGKEWYDELMNRGGWWTEYTLYNIFAELTQTTNVFHHSSYWMNANERSLRAKNSLNHNFWTPSQFQTWRGEDAFREDAAGLFMVCQSNSQIAPSVIWGRIRHHFPGSPLTWA